MGRSPCCAKEGLNRGAWTATEDKILTSYIKVHGEGKWRNLPKKAGLKRCGKSCRLRWLNYLKPDIKRGNITIDEEELIVRLHKLLGNRWSLIAGRLPGRTDNEIKNYWNTKIEKKLKNKENHQNANTSHEAPKNCHDQHQDKAGPIRTKASRCRKVSIPAELLSNGNIGPEKQQPDFNTKSILASKFPSSSVVEKSSPALEADISSDFLLDFEINEQFLTDILKMDFSEQVDFANGASLYSDDNNNTCDQGLLSPDSSKTLLASDELLHDNLEFPPTMTSIEDQAGLEFEWIQENQD